jgi:prefoldin alpha subunit
MEKDQQELMFKLSMFEQQIQNIQQQVQAIERAINDLSLLVIGLEDLNGSEGKEILAPIGRGIFVKSKVLSEELIVDIGGGNLISKTIPDTQDIIKKQIEKLEDAREEMNRALEEINGQLTETLVNAQKKD